MPQNVLKESAESVLMEPSCEMMRQTQSLPEETERRWALSQICGFYQHRCSTSELYSDSCIRIMGESCSSRLLQCSLINAMQNLEPAMETRTKGKYTHAYFYTSLCGQRVSGGKTLTQPHSRIMGGFQAPPGSWPWIVNLQLNGALMCGGVLVDSSWVLTAAHCFTGSQSEHYWTAVVGEFDITKADPDEQVMKVNRIITHPKFNPKTFNNDIALVELSSPVVLSERVMPVCLPSDPEPPPEAPCLVAGWGSLYEDGPAADVVMEAMVPLLSQSTCKSALGKQLLTSTMFCAGYLSGGIDSCQGDSGGPLILQDLTSGRFQLYGITSWGEGCGEKGKPGVYTRVVAYKDWILSEIQKSFGNREPTCAELLKTSELSEEQRMSEFTSLCHFYMLSCPITLNTSGCQRLAQDNCQSHFKKCRKGRELADMMERRKVDILCVQETRWKGGKARSIGAGFKLFYYGVDSKRNGVGVVLKEEFVRNVLEVGCELEEKERFWSELDEVMESIPTGERMVIGADFNGHVGEGNRGDEEVIGKFGVKERNLEGQMVVDFAKRMDMGVVNTYFQKREEHRVTYKSGDLEKAYDRVPREELWYCMRKSGVAEKCVRVVQDMYERSRTVVRCAVGQTEEFKVEVGLHQGSALSPFLFAIVMDQLSEEVRQESPWTMMFADDIVICSESREQNLERWRFALERRGMKVSRKLHFFLQTLLDLLERADDYIRDKVDLNFFTQSLPQLVEHVYSSSVNVRTRRQTLKTEQVGHSSLPTAHNPPSVFEQVGPLLDNWENNSIAANLEQHSKHVERNQKNKKENLLQQESNSTLHQLDRDLSSTITLVCFRLASRYNLALKHLERYSFWMDLIISRRASDILGGTLEPTLYPHMKDIMNWRTLVFQLLSCSDVIKPEDETSKTENLLKRTSLVPRAGLLTAPQELRTKKSSVQGGTHSWMSGLLEGRPVTSSTPIQLPLLLQLNSNKRTMFAQRRHRRQLLGGQIHKASNRVCPGVAELAQQVIVTKEMYNWILNITPSNLNMNFQEEKERFWSELDEVMESIPTGEGVVIGADFNGHVGEGNRGDEEVMGKFGVKERNLEGQMVVDFAKRMDMGVVNTYFQKREEHRVTYKSGGRRTQKLRQALGGQVVLPDDWETTAEVIRETGRKVLGVSSGRRKEDKETWWWNEEVQDSIQRKRLAKKKWDMDRTEENRQEYKELHRRVKREASKAKQKAYDELYTRLDTREGEKDLYRLARQRDRDGKDVQQVRFIKDRDGRVLTSEVSVQRRWKEYFEELMNEENEREKRVERVNSVEQKIDKIRKDEVRKALKRMKSGKAVGPDDIPVEVWKCLGEAAVEFLTSLFNRVLESERMPEEWRRSVLVPIFKNKGDVQSCSNYRGIKLMSHTMKLWERVVEARLRKVVEICEQQYGFMPRKSTTDAIFALRILMEKYRDGQRELHCVFVDLEKAYDRVPREELWHCMRKSGVAEKYVRVVQDMYERSRTVVRCAVGQTEEFKVEVGLHQGSALSPFLFAIVMDQLSEEVRQESPWTMMFADDIVICSESREQNLERWRFALERRGMKVSRSKTEYMCVNEREGSGTVRLQGEEVKK
ncbi:hypothetical protein QTP70_028862, partial [Hemibagrus guttatus]